MGHRGGLRTGASRSDVGRVGVRARRLALDHARGHRLREPFLARSLLLPLHLARNPSMRGSGNEGNLFHVYRHGETNYLAVEGIPSIWKIDEAHWRLLPATIRSAGLNGTTSTETGAYRSRKKPRSHPRVAHVPDSAPGGELRLLLRQAGLRTLPDSPRSRSPAGPPRARLIYGGDPDGEIYADCPARFTSNGYNDPRWAVFMHFEARHAGGCSPRSTRARRTGAPRAIRSSQAWDVARRPRWQVGELGPAPTTSTPGNVRPDRARAHLLESARHRRA